MENYTPTIGFFGQTGSGKSSLCNALFGEDICRVSDFDTCTMHPQELSLSIGSARLILIDFPGFGDSYQQDNRCLSFYNDFLPKLDVIIFVHKGDDRSSELSAIFFKQLNSHKNAIHKSFLIALNQVDKIHPFHDWDFHSQKPGPKQLEFIKRKQLDIANLFNVQEHKVIAVSASEGYGLLALFDSILRELVLNKVLTKYQMGNMKNIYTNQYIKKYTPNINANFTDDTSLAKNIQDELDRVKNYTPRIGVFGDTGVGKSSLCNAIFGQPIAKISNVLACTRSPQEIFIPNKYGSGIVLVDVPGIGEDQDRHFEYIELYKRLTPELDLILWAIRADDRKYMTSISAHEEISKIEHCCPIVFVVTQSDKIEPIDEWYTNRKMKLGKNQELNIKERINDISHRFKVSSENIIPVSASGSINLVNLVNRIVEVLPNQKKFAITREAKPENISKEAYKNAENGIIDYIKEVIGIAVEKVAEIVVEKVFSKIKSWFP